MFDVIRGFHHDNEWTSIPKLGSMWADGIFGPETEEMNQILFYIRL